MKTIYISRKKSGNLVMTSYQDGNWQLIGKATTPKELKALANSLGFASIITAEYSQSQGKKIAQNFSEKDALRAFGIPATGKNVIANF